MKKLQIAILAIGLTGTLSASAQVLTYYDTENILSPSYPEVYQAFNIPLFNPADGTLDSVSVTMSGVVQDSLSFTNFDGPTGGIAMSEDASLTVQYNDSQNIAEGDFVFQTTDYPTLQKPGADGGVYLQNWTGTLSPVDFDVSDPTDLADFTGVGNAPLAVGLSDSVGATISGGNYSYNNDTTGSGTVEVQYYYTPVPEPTTLALAGLGLGMLFVYRRKK